MNVLLKNSKLKIFPLVLILILIFSRLISELKTFVYRNGRPDHMDGYHDDIIMALAMPIFIVQTTFKKLEVTNF